MPRGRVYIDIRAGEEGFRVVVVSKSGRRYKSVRDPTAVDRIVSNYKKLGYIVLFRVRNKSVGD